MFLILNIESLFIPVYKERIHLSIRMIIIVKGQVDVAMNKRARQDEEIAEGRVVAEEAHTHMRSCCLLKQTDDALPEFFGVFKKVKTQTERRSVAPGEVSQVIQQASEAVTHYCEKLHRLGNIRQLLREHGIQDCLACVKR